MAATGEVLAANCRRDPACTSDPVADLAWLVQHGELDGSPLNGTSLMESLSILSLNSVNPTLTGIPGVLNHARNGDTARLKELFQDRAEPADGRGLPPVAANPRSGVPGESGATPPNAAPARCERLVLPAGVGRLGEGSRSPGGAGRRTGERAWRPEQPARSHGEERGQGVLAGVRWNCV